MRVLVKFPSRSRPAKFFVTLSGYIGNQITNDVKYFITIDEDDATMNNPGMLARMHQMGCIIDLGRSKSKIHAINRGMEKAPEFDILVLASDDMVCQRKGWDKLLQDEMTANFPDTDGVLFHWDGDKNTRAHNNGKGLNTMCILGRKYYDRFKYIYHPSYISLWVDNEFTEVADILEKQFRSHEVLFKHIHYSNTPGLMQDALMKKTQSYYVQDEKNYLKRKAENFGL